MFATFVRSRGARPLRVPRLMDRLADPGILQHLLRRECSRAARNGKELSLVLFELRGQSRRSMATLRLARTMLRRARMTDEIGWYDDQHLAALLPDTTSRGARSFANGVRELIEGRMDRPRALIYTYPNNWVMSEDDDQQTNGRKQRMADLVGAGAKANGNGHRKIRRHDLVPAFEEGFESELNEAPVTVGLEAAPLDVLLVRPLPMWKRAIDFMGALVLLLLFSPLMAFAAFAIKLTSHGPVIFAQRRAGLGGRPFTIYKFRTMCVDAERQKQGLRAISEQDGPAFKLTHDPRVTRIGSILRKTSIDELPQLFTVIKGDMSLVGPRPLPVDESQACQLWQRRRLDVTPGLTCIWQVEGRSRVTFDEWVRMDVKYIRRRNILHDISLIFRTIPAVLLRRGAR
jgi:lipopolysaccharide/colanic/teichoic acid biosynthesis glycosyltransferase